MAEVKGLLNFFLISFVGSSLYLNIRAWLLGDNVNKFLTLAVSILAIITLIVKLLIYIENLREKKHKNKIDRIEFELKYRKPKK